MNTGFDHPGPARVKTISTERAIVMLTRYQVQAVEIDTDNPRGLRFYLSDNHTVQMLPIDGRFRFGLVVR